MRAALGFLEIAMSSPAVLITGASRGIGKQLCIDFASAGYDVVCIARTSAKGSSKLPGSLEETAALVEARGRRAMIAPLDVRDEDAVRAVADRVHREWRRCDVLINNAAIAPPKPALQDSTKRWRLAVDVNVNGPFYLMHALCPRMTPGEGRVINISSGAAVFPEFGRPSYTATKLALEGMSQSLAHELRGKVAVNVLRLDFMVWSEGFDETLPAGGFSFEHPVVMSDAALWMARQPVDFTGRVLIMSELRERGIVRPAEPFRPTPR
jgi:NAD(P)-dependent dehydrogenase (short-subunit alcohol dehydrogenase family)